MIDQKSDYDFVTWPYDGSIQVDGSIMPIRQQSQNTTLRGEDVAFLYEVIQRTRKSSRMTTGGLYMTKRIDGDPVQDVITELRNFQALGPAYSGKPLYQSASFDQIYEMPNGGSPFKTPAQLNPDAAIYTGIVSQGGFFANGQPLSRTHMMEVFDDLKLIRRFQTDVTGSDDFGYWSHDDKTGGEEGEIPRVTAHAGNLYSFKCNGWIDVDHGDVHHSGWRSRTSQSGGYEETTPVVDLRYIRSTVLAFCIITAHKTFATKWGEGGGISQSEVVSYNYVVPVQTSVLPTCRGIGIGTETMNGIKDLILQRLKLDSFTPDIFAPPDHDGTDGMMECVVTFSGVDYIVAQIGDDVRW